MVAISIIVGWIFCGILAYGLVKNYERDFYSRMINVNYLLEFRYDSMDEFFCILSGFFGPIGLFVGLITALTNKSLELCFIMPKELCRPKVEK